MANVIGNGKARHLVDVDSDPIDDGAGKLNTTLSSESTWVALPGTPVDALSGEPL